VGPPAGPDLEREHKFLLDQTQHRALWGRLRDGARARAQENVFFDGDGLLRRARWLLRVRLEREPGRRDGVADDPPEDEPAWAIVRAFVTLKGPAVLDGGGVVRPEVEESVPPDVATAAAGSGTLALAALPLRLRDALGRLAKGGPPEYFSAFARFRNLRLALRVPTANGGIEVALDRARSGDGRVRHELEVEWRAGDADATRDVLARLGVAAYRPTTRGKLAWLIDGDAG
jgi:adenylate cyclase class IV